MDKATIVVADRSNATSAEAQKKLENSGFEDGSPLCAQPLRWQPQALSSTQVRTSVVTRPASPNAATTMVPTAVARYISQHQFYIPPCP
jgi:nicotinic acid mononucleotide adenylyltransferase